jgi:hypothetical protein
MSYDSNKHYQWNPDEQFTISGREFGLILNTVRAILSTEQAQQILLAARASDVLEKIMEENIKTGKIVEKEMTHGNKEEKLDTGSRQG